MSLYEIDDKALFAFDEFVEAEPRRAEDTHVNKRNYVISNTFKEYSSAVDEPLNDIDFSKRRSCDDGKEV